MGKLLATIIIGIILLVMIGIPAAILIATEQDVNIHVKNKERVVQSSGEGVNSRYLIYTEDEVFQNTDSLIFLKWNSSDVYNRLDEGGDYNVRVAGWRVPFLSWYRNIIRINE